MSAAISIRRVYKDGAVALAALHGSCFSEPWSSASFESLMESSNTFALAAIGDAKPRTFEAFIVARVAADEAEILTLGTAPARRRNGLARALVLAAAAEAHGAGASKIFLEVASDNAAAAALYSSIGFSGVGGRPRYYRDKTNAMDAMIMRARLPLTH